jgi:hypothetical protein
MSRLDQLLETPHAGGHFVQLYGSNERLLTANVAQYLYEGLKRGDGLLVIATAEHVYAFTQKMRRLGADVQAAIADRQLIFVDARDTLARIMVGGQPDWRLFERAIGTAIGRVEAQPESGGLRAYGEMVGLLWNEGKCAAAIRMEQLWNQLLGSLSFNLYCAYPIDVFSNEFQIAALDALLCAHTHVVPAAKTGDLETAVHRSMDDILGRRAEGLRRLMEGNVRPSWAVMSKAEADILWLRNNLPDDSESILERARQYYQVSHTRTSLVQDRRATPELAR